MGYDALTKLFYKSPADYEQIYRHRFQNEAALHFQFEIHKNPAFLVMNLELLQEIEQIYRCDKQLTWISGHLPRIAKQQYTTWAVIEEIKLTNEIEGVRSTREEIQLLVEGGLPFKHKERLWGFVQQYRSLMNQQSIDLSSCEAVRRLYDSLCLYAVTDEDPCNQPDGTLFRKDAVSILSETQKELHQGLFPERAIIDAMTCALAILNDPDLPVLVRIPVFHYLFAYIHPFYDGNGRMDRFISSYFLAWNFNPLLGYNLSFAIKKELPTYYKLFKETNDPRGRGDLTPFTIGFLRLIRHCAEDLNRSLLKRLDKLTFYREKLLRLYANDNRFHVLHILLLNTLFGYRGLRAKELANAAELSESTVRSLLRELSAQTNLIARTTDARHHLYALNLEALHFAAPAPLPDFQSGEFD